MAQYKSAYTGQQIDAAIGKIQKMEGITILTSDDYDYPTNAPELIAGWLLEPGVYKIEGTNVGISRHPEENHALYYDTGDIFIKLTEAGDVSEIDPEYIYTQRKNHTFSHYVNKDEIGELLQISDIIDNLTSSNSYAPLSAKQGKKLKDEKQDLLVSGQNIKTVNNQSLLGSGNINVSGDVSNKEISILFIGNSLTQDAIAYLPYVLKNSYPDLTFHLYIWYIGGAYLSDHLERFNNDTNQGVSFYACENTISWDSNHPGSMPMSQILQRYNFDIICIQEYFNHRSEEYSDTSDFKAVVKYIKDHYKDENDNGKPFRVASLFHAPFRPNAVSVFEKTKAGNELILKTTEADSIVPVGISIYRALSDSVLQPLGDMQNLTPDGTHAQEGLPCLMQSYAAALWLYKILGIPKGFINDNIRITTEIYNSIDVPGPNIGTGVITGTLVENEHAQTVAVNSFLEGLEMEIEAFDENNGGGSSVDSAQLNEYTLIGINKQGTSNDIYTPEEAIEAIPTINRKAGLKITFRTSEGIIALQFINTNVANWSKYIYWVQIPYCTIGDVIPGTPGEGQYVTLSSSEIMDQKLIKIDGSIVDGDPQQAIYVYTLPNTSRVRITNGYLYPAGGNARGYIGGSVVDVDGAILSEIPAPNGGSAGFYNDVVVDLPSGAHQVRLYTPAKTGSRLPILEYWDGGSGTPDIYTITPKYPAETSLKPVVSTSLPTVAVVNTIYSLGQKSSLSVTLPETAEIGDNIEIQFVSGTTATNLNISSTANIYNNDIVPDTNTQYDIIASWENMGSSEGWKLYYSEVSLGA